MSETRHVTIRRGSEVQHATIWFGPMDGAVHLDLRLDKGRTLAATEADYFDCLVTVRRVLEQEGGLILCQGARRDVWPSGMARSMGAGLKAYALVNGRTPSTQHLVAIFDPAEPLTVGTVAEQEQTRDEWLASRGLPPLGESG